MNPILVSPKLISIIIISRIHSFIMKANNDHDMLLSKNGEFSHKVKPIIGHYQNEGLTWHWNPKVRGVPKNNEPMIRWQPSPTPHFGNVFSQVYLFFKNKLHFYISFLTNYLFLFQNNWQLNGLHPCRFLMSSIGSFNNLLYFSLIAFSDLKDQLNFWNKRNISLTWGILPSTFLLSLIQYDGQHHAFLL
jgi:hypothetical protein